MVIRKIPERAGRRTSRSSLQAAAACALAAVAVLGASQTAMATTPRQPAGATPVLGEDHAHVGRLASLVEAQRATFGGISFDQRTGIATVRYDDSVGESTARSRLGLSAGAHDSRRVVLKQVRHSLQELDAVRERVASDPAWRAAAGTSVAEWYADVERNVVAVGVTELTAGVAQAARRLFGDLVRLHVAARGERTSRVDDFEPWTAGIRINIGGSGCTSGFVIRTIAAPIQRRLVTAAHCGALGATVTNNGDVVGTVVQRIFTERGLDVAYVGGRSYEAWMYTHGPDSDIGQWIRGATPSAVGLPVCTNGATSGENCNGRVTAVDVCFRYDDGVTSCFLSKVESTNGSVIARPGDSGGPVITYDAGGLKVMGTIIGPAGTTTYFHSFQRLVPAGWTVDYLV